MRKGKGMNHSPNACGRQQVAQETLEVFRGVGQPNHRATLVRLLGVARAGKEVSEDGRLRGEKALVHLEPDIPGDYDDVPVFEPELLVSYGTSVVRVLCTLLLTINPGAFSCALCRHVHEEK